MTGFFITKRNTGIHCIPALFSLKITSRFMSRIMTRLTPSENNEFYFYITVLSVKKNGNPLPTVTR